MFFNFNPMFNFRSIEQQVTSNPQFKQFYEQNKDKSVEQICKDYNLDYNTIKNLINIK